MPRSKHHLCLYDVVPRHQPLAKLLVHRDFRYVMRLVAVRRHEMPCNVDVYVAWPMGDHVLLGHLWES